MYIKQWDMGQDTGSVGEWLSERGNKGNGPSASAHCLEQFPDLSTYRENPSKALGLSVMRRQSLEFREAMVSRLDGKKYWRGGSWTERAAEVCRGFFMRLKLSSALCMNVRKGKDLLEWSRWNNPWSSPRTEKSSCFHWPAWKNHLTVAQQVESLEGDCLRNGAKLAWG